MEIPRDNLELWICSECSSFRFPRSRHWCTGKTSGWNTPTVWKGQKASRHRITERAFCLFFLLLCEVGCIVGPANRLSRAPFCLFDFCLVHETCGLRPNLKSSVIAQLPSILCQFDIRMESSLLMHNFIAQFYR